MNHLLVSLLAYPRASVLPSRFWSGWWWSAIRGALSGGEKGDDAALLSTSQLQYHRQYEAQLEQRVQEMVERVLGPNMAIVRVSVDMDFTRLEQVGAVKQFSFFGEILGVPVEVCPRFPRPCRHRRQI